MPKPAFPSSNSAGNPAQKNSRLLVDIFTPIRDTDKYKCKKCKKIGQRRNYMSPADKIEQSLMASAAAVAMVDVHLSLDEKFTDAKKTAIKNLKWVVGVPMREVFHYE